MLKLFSKRTVVETVHGYQAENELRNLFNKHIARKSDGAISEALQLYHRGDNSRVLTMLAEAARSDPQNVRIPLTLTKLLMRDNRHEEAHQLLSALPTDQRDVPEIRNLRVHIGGLLALLDMLGHDNELAKRYRKEMLKFQH